MPPWNKYFLRSTPPANERSGPVLLGTGWVRSRLSLLRLTNCRSTAALFCLGSCLIACPSGESLTVRDLGFEDCGGLAPAISPFARVLEDKESYEQLFSELIAATPPPEVDFAVERVVVAYSGRRDECGATVYLRDAVYEGGKTVVTIVRHELGLGCFGDGALSGPVTIFAVPRMPGALEIEEAFDIEEPCRSGQ